MTAAYDPIAAYYDLIHDPLEDDIASVVTLAVASGGPILELGCGSGRLLLPLGRAGLEVTGIDSSPVMLARAQARLAADPSAAARVHLVQADMAAFDLPGTAFALAIFGYNTFMHLDEQAALAALRCVRAHLLPGGRVWLDLENPFVLSDLPETGALELEAEFEYEAGEKKVRLWSAYAADAVEQAVDVLWVYEIAGRDGSAQRIEAQFRQHYTYPHQLDLLLSQAGLRLISLSGDYDGAPFDEDSGRLIALAIA
jgi:SAM-dependent methyltransferase